MNDPAKASSQCFEDFSFFRKCFQDMRRFEDYSVGRFPGFPRRLISTIHIYKVLDGMCKG
jgi:hypothetical protein